jgi:Barstar (barnase inhibitor)
VLRRRATTFNVRQMQRPKEITVDLSACNDETSLFKHLWKKLDFPSLYTVSWDGLGENMFYDPDMRMPDIIIVRGFDSFADVDPVSAKKLETALSCYLLEEPNRKIIYEEAEQVMDVNRP